MKTPLIYLMGALSAIALAGCDPHEPEKKPPTTTHRDGHGATDDPHEEHEQHPRSIHSTIERATGAAPDHKGPKP